MVTNRQRERRKAISVTIKDVAQRAGVSTATAARVVGSYGYASQEARRKVLQAVEELGYQPDAVARSMVTKSTRTLGLVVTDIENPFFARAARGVTDVAQKHGYTVLLANTDEDVEKERQVLQVLQEKRVEGLILVPASTRQGEHVSKLQQRRLPVVLLDRWVRGLAVDVVMADNAGGAYQAVAHLIKLGHRRIGVVTDNLDIASSFERLEGYRRALADHGLPIDESLILVGKYTQEDAYAKTAELLARRERLSALFTTNNFMTIGAFKAIKDAGLRIPDDIALVGFDDMDWTTLGHPQLTTVAQPVYELGRTAAELVIQRIGSLGDAAREIRLKTQFIVRESCGATRAPD